MRIDAFQEPWFSDSRVQVVENLFIILEERKFCSLIEEVQRKKLDDPEISPPQTAQTNSNGLGLSSRNIQRPNLKNGP